MVAGYKIRYNLMSIWAFISKMLPLLTVVHSVFGTVTRQRKGPRLSWEVSSLSQDVQYEFEITQEGVSELPANGWCLLISRAAAGHRHANTHTYTQTRSQSLYLPLLVCSGQMAFGFCVASSYSPLQLDPFFCGDWQAVG